MKVRHNYRFGNYLFSADNNELKAPGEQSILEQKVADLLLVFCQHPGEVLQKDWLIQQVWPERVVNEDSLSVAISKLRRILSDNRHNPAYIKTLTGKGYLWLPEVTSEPVTDMAHPAADAQQNHFLPAPNSLKSVSTYRKAILAILALGLVITAFAIWRFFADSGQQEQVTMLLPDELAELAVLAEERLQSTDAEQQREAIELYRKVLDREPDYLDAYVGIAKAKLELSALQNYLDIELYAGEVRALLDHVLENDPENAGAWGLQATLYFLVDWNFDKADQAFKKAIEYAPEDPSNYLPYTEFLLARGEFAQAEQYLNQLRAINPSYYRYMNMSFVYLMRNEPEQALAEIRRLQNSEAHATGYNRMLHRLGILLGDEALAFSELEILFNDHQLPPAHIEPYKEQFRQHGLKGVFAMLLQQRVDLNIGHYLPPMAWARYAVVAEQPEQAIRWLKEAVEKRQVAALFIGVDPHYLPLRNHPEFQALLQQLPQ